eukprot:TRINITY_DN5771_c0_g1_i1.p1 TRINITY_DN5771_c0_g1~~TRINITY_DN5771_c0_g1_i1.p1  ORF type:complete len:266 (-),score=25.93 TRINITY_DN5771_c0_g1_i1:19-816(-)
MDTIITQIEQSYAYYMSLGDPRVSDFPLMSSPFPTMILCACYLIVLKVGMFLMKDREAFKLKQVMPVYNMFLVCLSAYMTWEFAYQGFYLGGYSVVCNAVDYSENGLGMAKIAWIFYFSKFIEFLDTIWMVLKKNNHQISFLHVYHHIATFSLWWIGVKYVAGGDSFFSAMMNSFVHVIMYSYYFMASIGIRDVWWKKYITQIQMTQFLINIAHCVIELYFDCPFPRWMGWAMLGYMASLFLLFLNFYLRSYQAKKKQQQKTKKD